MRRSITATLVALVVIGSFVGEKDHALQRGDGMHRKTAPFPRNHNQMPSARLG
jgi:hypothetical protein